MSWFLVDNNGDRCAPLLAAAPVVADDQGSFHKRTTRSHHACGLQSRTPRPAQVQRLDWFSRCIALSLAVLLILAWGYSYRDCDTHDFVSLNYYGVGGVCSYTVFRGDFAVVWFPAPNCAYVPSHLE